MRRRPAAVLPVVAAAALAYAAATALRLAAFDWDPSAFVVAGDGVTDPAAAPPWLGLHLGTDGYDGQAYHRLARDPLTLAVTEDGTTFTRPAYWQARIGYPLVVWALSLGGRGALVPELMLVVNLAALLVVAAGAALLARGLGRSPWWGLVPALWAGFVVGVMQDLTEPLAGALLVLALLALQRGHAVAAAAALTAAALTRETSLVLAIAVVAAWAWHRWGGPSRDGRGGPAWWVGAIPLAAYAGWRTWVRARWAGVVPDPPPDSPLTVPLVELAGYLGRAAGDAAAQAGNLVLLVPTLAVLGVLASALAPARSGTGAGTPVDGRGDLHLRLALAAYLVLLACLPVWDRGQAYLRWCCEPVLLGWLLLLRRPAPGRRLAVAGLVAATWVAAVALTHTYPDPDRFVPADERSVAP